MEQVEQELQKLIALESALDKLGALRDQVKQQGMSKNMAMEARELIHDFDGNRPLAFYSARPSYAHQMVALEEMSEALGALIGAIVIALAVLIAKAVDYFFGKKTNSDGGGGGGANFRMEWHCDGKTFHSYADLNRYRNDKINRYYEEMKKQMEKERHERAQNATDNSASNADPLPQIDQLIEQEIKEKGEDSPLGRILLAEDPFSMDLIKGGEYTRTLTASLAVVPTLGKHMVSIQSEIATVTRDYPYVMEHPALPDNELADLYDRLNPTGIENGKFRDINWNINGLVTSIQEAKDKMQGSIVGQRFKYSELARKVESVLEHLPVRKMIDASKECEKDLPDIEAKLRKLGEGMDKYKGRADLTEMQKDYQEYASDMVKVIRQDVTGTIKYLQELDRFGRAMRAMENRMFKMEVEIVRLIAKAAKERGVLTPEMKKLEKTMLEDLTIDA